jgi:hypothetical protein
MLIKEKGAGEILIPPAPLSHYLTMQEIHSNPFLFGE